MPSLQCELHPVLHSLQVRPVEREVLQLVAQGLRTREVAAALELSPLTINVHLRAIYRRAGHEGASSARVPRHRCASLNYAPHYREVRGLGPGDLGMAHRYSSCW